jgi:hypothetical protein
MDFGFGRFLEMFEARFGQRMTTALLGVLALAAGCWSIKTVIEFAVYVYDLPVKSHFLTAVQTDSIIGHIIFFGVQFLLTIILAIYLFNKLIVVRVKSLKKYWDKEIAKVEERHALILKKHADLRRLIELHKNAVEKTEVAYAVIQKAVEEKIQFIKAKEAEAKSAREPPHQE